MGILDIARRAFGINSTLLTATQSLQRHNINEIVKNNIARYPNWDIQNNSERYCSTDDIYSIIKLIAGTSAMIPFYVYQIKNENASKKLKSLTATSEVRLHKAYSVKALEDVAETDQVYQLLENPNDYQSKFEFLEVVYTSLAIDGEAFIYKECPDLGINAGKPTSLHIIEPQNVVLRVTSSFPQFITGYDYIINGIKILDNVDVNKIIHIKYHNPSNFYNGNDLRGLSPLKVLNKRLTRMDSNLDAAVSQMQNGGVPGIVWDKDTTEAAIEIIGQRKSAYSEYTRNKDNKGAPYFASGEMGYIPIGLKLADLESAQLENIDFKKLCNAYGVSDILFNNADSSTESNVKEQTKRLYTNTCLPNVYRLRDALIKGLLPDFDDSVNRTISADISEIPELQENYKDLAEWLDKSWWVSPNEKREIMKFDRLEDETFDTPILPSGLQLLSDLQPLPELPNTNDFTN